MALEKEAVRPWWEKGMFVALVGAMIPIATFIQGMLQKNRELELQSQQQVQQLRLAYANMMAESGVERMAFLADFIAATEEDARIRDWAVKQQTAIRVQQKKLEEQIELEQEKALAADKARIEAQARAAEAERRLAAAEDEAARERARIEKEKAATELATANLKANTAYNNLDVSRSVLKGRDTALSAEAMKALRTQQAIVPVAPSNPLIQVSE